MNRAAPLDVLTDVGGDAVYQSGIIDLGSASDRAPEPDPVGRTTSVRRPAATMLALLMLLVLGGSVRPPSPLTLIAAPSVAVGPTGLTGTLIRLSGGTLYASRHGPDGNGLVGAYGLPGGSLRWTRSLPDWVTGLVPVERSRVVLVETFDNVASRQAVTAFDAVNGRRLWAAEPYTYVADVSPEAARPVLVTGAGGEPVTVRAVDARTGGPLWSLPLPSGTDLTTSADPGVDTGTGDRSDGRLLLQSPGGPARVVDEDTGTVLATGLLGPMAPDPPTTTVSTSTSTSTSTVGTGTATPVAAGAAAATGTAGTTGTAAGTGTTGTAAGTGTTGTTAGTGTALRAPSDYGYSIVGDAVFVSAPSGDNTVVAAYALDTLTERWRIRLSTFAYRVAGCGEVLCVSGRDCGLIRCVAGPTNSLTTLDPATGAVRWRTVQWSRALPVGGRLLAYGGLWGYSDAVVRSATGAPLLRLDRWSAIGHATDEHPTLLATDAPGGQGVWFAVLRDHPLSIHPLDVVPDLAPGLCQVSRDYLACPVPSGAINVWRYRT